MSKNKVKTTVFQLYKKDPIDSMDIKEFEKIAYTFLSNLVDFVKETGFYIKFPLNLGTFGIKKVKIFNAVFDYEYYHNTGEKRYHKNRHSEGYVARFDYINQKPAPIFWAQIPFRFKAVRHQKRQLAKDIMKRNIINKYYG